MRRTKEKLFLLLILILQLSCTKEQSIEMYDLNPLLNAKVQQANQSNDSVKLDLCNQIPFKWEKIIIIPPYSNDKDVKKYNLANAKFIEKQLPVLALDEDRCIFLFVKSDTIVRYGFVPRVPIDFNYINNTDSIKTLAMEIFCNQLYIKNDNHKLKLAY